MPTRVAALRSFSPGRLVACARSALDLGYERVGLLAPLYSSDLEALEATLAQGLVACLELFLPFPREVCPGQGSPFRLGSPDAEDKRDAVKYGTESILYAERHGIPSVLLPPVPLSGELRKSHRRLLERRELRALLPSLVAERRSEAASRLDAYRSVLWKLLHVADRYGVHLALAPAGWLDELPDAAEAEACLREFHGAPLGVWPDTLEHAVALETGLDSSRAWERFSGCVIGVTLRDGDAEWNAILPRDGSRSSRIWQRSRAILEAGQFWMVDPPDGTQGVDLRECLEFVEALGAGRT